jgi:DNA-binding NtrC family response regulator
MAKAVVLCPGSQIWPLHIEFPISAPLADPQSEDEAVANLQRAVAWAFQTNQPNPWTHLHRLLERELLTAALLHCENQTAVATRFGLSWNTVSKLLKEYKLKD